LQRRAGNVQVALDAGRGRQHPMRADEIAALTQGLAGQ
jgi:hypothetical protein